MLLRGHNQPGGGFIGGLIAALSFILIALASGPQVARKAMTFSEKTYIALGLAIATFSGILGFFAHKPFLSASWGTLKIPLLGELALGTPLLFDIGVFLVVIGMITMVLLALIEEVS